MALNIQAPNLSGLAGIAGKYTNMNIAPTGALGLEALRTNMAKEEALRRDTLAKMGMQQQGELQLRQQDMQRQQMAQQAEQAARQGLFQNAELDFRKQQAGMQGDQFKDRLALEQQQLAQQGALSQQGIDVKKQEIFADMQKQQMAQLLKEDKEAIRAKGAYVSYGLMSMNDAKTPQEAQQIWSEISKEAVEKKYMTKEQAAQLGQLPLSQRKNMMKGMLISLGEANAYKSLQESSGKPGEVQIKYNADGAPQEINIGASNTVKNKVEGELIDREEALKNLAPIRDEFNEKYFTAKNQAQVGLSKKAERYKDIPMIGEALDKAAEVVSGGKDSEQRAEDIKGATKYLNAVEQFFTLDFRKPVTGAAAAKDELSYLRKIFLNGDMSPSEFRGALDGVLERYTSESEFKKNVLKKGIDVSPKEQPKYNFTKEEIEAEKARRRGLK